MGYAALYSGEKSMTQWVNIVEFATKIIFVLTEYHSKYSCN